MPTQNEPDPTSFPRWVSATIGMNDFRMPPSAPQRSDEELCITEAHKATGVDWRMLFGIVRYYHGREPYINCVTNLCEALCLEAVTLPDGDVYYKLKAK